MFTYKLEIHFNFMYFSCCYRLINLWLTFKIELHTMGPDYFWSSIWIILWFCNFLRHMGCCGMSVKLLLYRLHKCQLNSEWIYEVIVSPKMPTKNYQDFCPGSLFEGRAFWEKRWTHKFILNLTDLYVACTRAILLTSHIIPKFIYCRVASSNPRY